MHWWNILDRLNLRTERAGGRLASKEHRAAFRKILLAGVIAAALGGVSVGMLVGASAGILVGISAVALAWFYYTRTERCIDEAVDKRVGAHLKRNRSRI